MSLMEKYNINKGELVEWAKKTYPQFVNNENLIAQLYLRQVKNIVLEASTFPMMRGKRIKVSDIKMGEWCVIEVAVATKIRDNSYTGCTNCFSKMTGNSCPKCGETTSTIHWFTGYMAGDESGDVTLSFPPKYANDRKSFEGKILRIRGIMSDQGDFLANSIQEIGAKVKQKQVAIDLITEQPKSAKKVEVDKPKEVMIGSTDVDQNELASINKLFEVFPKISYDDIKKWHQQRKITTSIEVLIKAAGAEIKESDVIKAS